MSSSSSNSGNITEHTGAHEVDGVLYCVECGDVPALVHCEQCNDDFCGLCFRFQHHRGSRTAHTSSMVRGADPAKHLVGDGTTDMFRQLQGIEQDITASLAGKMSITDAPQLITSSGSKILTPSKKEEVAEKIQKRRSQELKKEDVSEMKVDKEDKENKVKKDKDAMEISPKRDESESSESESESDEENESVPSIVIQSHWVPLRLTAEERDLFNVLEGVLGTSEYTDKVDVAFDDYGWRTSGMKKDQIIKSELNEIFSLISGLYLASNFQAGRRIVENSFEKNVEFFQKVFEIGRRFKILNPDKMRTTYGKLLHLLQDAATTDVLDFDVVIPIKTVFSFLTEKGCISLLEDNLIGDATKFFSSSEGSEEGIKRKQEAEKELVKKYRRDGFDEEDILLAIRSLSDANAYLALNRDPVQKALDLLHHYFPQSSPKEKNKTLEIIHGDHGSCLSHTHETQFEFVKQSLTLWREIQANMFKLWILADKDMLNSQSPYRLYNTGQGLNRMQSAPNISRAMSEILHRVQGGLSRGWVGLSVVHLGDRDVPNALFFIDKYTQVPRILGPIVKVIEHIDNLSDDPNSKQILEVCGGAEYVKVFILRDFFRHGFDGSGSDGGSCVDGRLTSAWNWCSKCHKKQYYPIMQATGFTSFDGDFK
eukprot:TRINITY_DN4193_c0_g1_i5.p1 TRINITY_DN4193_c0_g1~~TRINITY_DN4193_c0_g1_i5.p1  ORF type:complete len:653 (+),score=156.79 TRINITY_DN4193_c0_g1_i5:23-1981(+)